MSTDATTTWDWPTPQPDPAGYPMAVAKIDVDGQPPQWISGRVDDVLGEMFALTQNHPGWFIPIRVHDLDGRVSHMVCIEGASRLIEASAL